jgi:hypothetical protein
MADFRGANRERGVSYFTLRTIIILMETTKDLYKTSLDHASKLSQIEVAFAALNKDVDIPIHELRCA